MIFIFSGTKSPLSTFQFCCKSYLPCKTRNDHGCGVQWSLTVSQPIVVPAKLEVDSSIYTVSVVCLQERARCFMTTSFMSGSYKIISLLKQTCHNVYIQMGIVLQSHDLGKISHALA